MNMVGEVFLAFYLRLSMEDGDIISDENKDESNSIVHQRELLSRYRKEQRLYPNLKVLEFVDDGYSGTSFNRPAIKELLSLVKEGKICCILVKDISRFGRNYLDVGDYLEQVFPFLGVRFISINDHYDSDDYLGTTGGIDLALRSLFYDWYSKDLSVKMRSALKIRRERGDFTGPFAPFGYQKSKTRKNRLEIDEEAAEYVKRIFQLACLGYSTGQIAVQINKEGIPTPMQYKNRKKEKLEVVDSRCYWKQTNVRKILQDRVYTGMIVTPKMCVTEVGGSRFKRVPDEQRMFFPNMHEAIISEQEFIEASRVIRNQGEQIGKNHSSKEISVLQGKLRCGGCHRSLLRNPCTSIPVFTCERVRFTEAGDCFSGKLKEPEAEQIVLQEIRKKLSETETPECRKALEGSRALEKKQKREIQRKLASIKDRKQHLYECYRAGEFDRNLYSQKADALREEETQLQELLSELELSKAKASMEEDKVEELTKELVDRHIKEIFVYDEEKIEIIWNM